MVEGCAFGPYSLIWGNEDAKNRSNICRAVVDSITLTPNLVNKLVKFLDKTEHCHGCQCNECTCPKSSCGNIVCRCCNKLIPISLMTYVHKSIFDYPSYLEDEEAKYIADIIKRHYETLDHIKFLVENI